MSGQAKRKLLVLDDDAGVVDFLCESLTERGFEVTGITSPREALLRIKTDSFDLVITDVEMPQMRGTELLAAILCEKPSQLVLLITAFGSIDLAVATVQSGACDFIATRADLDPSRIGCMGISGGGTVTLYAAALDERIRANPALGELGIGQQKGGNIL